MAQFGVDELLDYEQVIAAVSMLSTIVWIEFWHAKLFKCCIVTVFVAMSSGSHTCEAP